MVTDSTPSRRECPQHTALLPGRRHPGGEASSWPCCSPPYGVSSCARRRRCRCAAAGLAAATSSSDAVDARRRAALLSALVLAWLSRRAPRARARAGRLRVPGAVVGAPPRWRRSSCVSCRSVQRTHAVAAGRAAGPIGTCPPALVLGRRLIRHAALPAARSLVPIRTSPARRRSPSRLPLRRRRRSAAALPSAGSAGLGKSLGYYRLSCIRAAFPPGAVAGVYGWSRWRALPLGVRGASHRRAASSATWVAADRPTGIESRRGRPPPSSRDGRRASRA